MSQRLLEVEGLPGLLRARAEERAPRRAYIFLGDGSAESGSLTYAELDLRARALAGILTEVGARGERVLLLHSPGLELLAAFFGCLYAGAVAVPCQPPHRRKDQPRLRAIAGDARPWVVLSDGLAGRRADLVGQVPELSTAAWIDTREISGDLASSWLETPCDLEAPAFLQYTSGSTATPKGVIVSHANLLHNQEMIRRAFGQSEESAIVGWLPLYHDMGLIGNVLQPLYVGAPCVLMPPVAFLQRPARWLEAVSRYGATTSGGPDFAYDLCARKVTAEEKAGLDLSSWRVAFSGAEPVRAGTLERFAAAFAPCGFHREAFQPCYGLAEATLLVSTGAPGSGATVRAFDARALEADRAEPAQADAPGRQLVGCGHSWLDQEVLVVDPESGAPLPDGRVGEVWVAGPSVAQGYFDRPEETARTFGARVPGRPERFLRTGDLGFFAAGELFLAGRLKDLVILRGRNLYPQDLELTAERSHPGLRPGGGAAFSVETGADEALVLVLEMERGSFDRAAEAAEAVRRAIAEEHEVTVHEVVLVRPGGVPRTSSGKIRRNACRNLWRTGALDGVLAALARRESRVTETAASWTDPAELLALPSEERPGALVGELRRRAARVARVDPDEVDPRQPLTQLGIDSLGAIELQHGIQSALAVEVPMARLLSDAPLEEIAREILAGLSASAPLREEAAPSPGQEFPLSYGQRSLWFLEQRAPGLLNLAGAARLRGALDPDTLGQVFAALTDRHPALRTVFKVRDGEPVQRVLPSLPPEILVIEAQGEDQAAVQARIQAEVSRPFDLERGPLLRVGILRAAGEHALFLAVHHLVADLWSLALLLRELEALFAEARGGEPARLAPIPASFADHVAAERRMLEGERGAGLLAFWRDQLAGELPVLDLPTDRPRPPVQTYRGAARGLRLDAGTALRLKELARRQGATFYTALAAGFEALLHRYTGQEDLLLGTPTSGRSTPEMARVVGYFVSPVALRSDLSGDPGFAELLRRTRRAALAAFEHGAYPLALLTERLQPRRDPSRPPIFQALFVLEQAALPGTQDFGAFALGEAGVRLDLAGLSGESIALEPRGTQLDLMLLAAELDGGLAFSLEHNADLFDPATADRLLSHLRGLLSGAVESPELPVGDLPLLAAAELDQLRAEAPAESTGEPLPALHELFQEHAARAPEAVAVVLELETLTYGELDRRSNRLARHLRRLGVGAETRVCLALDRSPDLVVSLLAVLKAGGAYVPLDPASPAERLAFLLEDVQEEGRETPLLISRASLLPELAEAGVHRLLLDRDSERIAAESSAPPESAGPGGDGLAYVIYTSGSTGRPKGVQVTHANVVRLFRSTEGWFGFGPADVWTLFHSYAFDFSVWEIWGALLYGGRLVIVPREATRSPERFRELLASEEVTVLNQTPSAFRQLVHHEQSEGDGLPPLSLRLVIFGGEALEPGSLRPWIERHGVEKPRLVNMYGITETTVHVTARPLGEEEILAGGASLVGRPIPDLAVHLLDRRLRPVPVGVPGEICVGGAGVARGYLHRPGLTAERFVPDLFAWTPGARLYRSGDRARWRPDGDLEYLGRIDHQVKVRGFRIEPGEIEAALVAHPGVRQAVVVARRDEPEETRLVAYVVPTGPSALSVTELREHLARSLPEPLIPAAFVSLAALPLTGNGKIDRAALPAPEGERPELAAAFAAPRTLVERRLAEIWTALLGVREIGLHDDFFELGGHSLLQTRLISRIRAAFGLELSLAQVFGTPTIAGQAALLAAARGGAPAAPIPPIPRVSRMEPIPLSFGQERLWFLDQIEDRERAAPAYNVPARIRLSGNLDRSALGRALRRAAERHEALRTSFPAVGGRPVQAIAPEPPSALAELPLVDLSALPDPGAEAALRSLTEARAPFDLAAGPLIRATLLRLGSREHHLLLTLHHAVSDGWSLGLLLHELSHGYGVDEPLPPLPLQYADFAAWQRNRLKSGELDGQIAWWKEHLTGAPSRLELPLDRPRPLTGSFRGRQSALLLPPGLAAALEELGRRRDATLFMTLLAGFAALLSRATGQDDLVIGSPVAGRGREELEELIGFFVNLLPLRARLSGNPRFGTLLAELRREILESWAHQDLPFERLVAEARPGRSPGESPLVQVVLALQNAPMPAPRLAGLEVEPVGIHNGTAKFDLTLEATVVPDGLLLTLEHSDLIDAAHAERLLGSYRSLLEGAAADPDARLADLPVLSVVERHQLLQEWNDRAAAYPETASLQTLFEERARLAPEALAAAFDGTELTYRELSCRANRLAAVLRSAGVGPESRVGLCLERSLDLIVGMVGIIKAGGAYVPLDPAYPRERLAFMAEDSGLAALVTETRHEPLFAGWVPAVVRLDADRELLAARSAENPPVLTDGGSLAYVIYTSGSTGTPKGVEVVHRAVSRLVLGTDYVDLGPAERIGQAASASFDAITFEVWGALLHGGCVVGLRAEVALAPGVLEEELRARRVTTLFLTTALFQQTVRDRPAAFSSLRCLLVGGETADPRRFREALAAPPRRLLHVYGPTESTTFALWHTVEEVPQWASTVPIGRPLANTRLAVLDRFGGPVPPGSSGELCLGGDGLARGYRGRPELTAERFVPDPSGMAPGGRLYRTGDLVRQQGDGAVEFLGRIDQQVKIRGFRIEPGEVEGALAAHPDLAGVAVLAREDAPGDRRLVAYFVPRPNSALTDAANPSDIALRGFLADRLPPYMLPSVFVRLEELPLNANGKVDRRALPRPEGRGGGGGVPPTTPVERELARIWAEALGCGVVGAEDNFFELGGHSLLITQLVDRYRETFGIEVSVRDLFDAPTVAELGRVVERRREERTRTAPPPIARAARDQYRQARRSQA